MQINTLQTILHTIIFGHLYCFILKTFIHTNELENTYAYINICIKFA